MDEFELEGFEEIEEMTMAEREAEEMDRAVEDFYDRANEAEISFGAFAKSESGWDLKRIKSKDRTIEIIHFDKWKDLFRSMHFIGIGSDLLYWKAVNLDNEEEYCKIGKDSIYDDNNWEPGFEYPPLFHIGAIGIKENGEKYIYPRPIGDKRDFVSWEEAKNYLNERKIEKILEAAEELKINEDKYNTTFRLHIFDDESNLYDNCVIYDDLDRVYGLGYTELIYDILSEKSLGELANEINEKKEEELKRLVLETEGLKHVSILNAIGGKYEGAAKEKLIEAVKNIEKNNEEKSEEKSNEER